VLTVGSLFAGIGGFDLGLERAGMRTVWQVEREPFCRAVLERHFPHARRYDDVREVGSHNLAPVDLICGGFPCQDLSWAGAGAGIGGERSGLWSEYARVVGELRPRYVVVENVAALLARGMGVVLGDLAALGYDAEWDCVPASAVGAPHQRDRLWLVAYSDGGGREPRFADLHAGGPDAEGCCCDVADPDCVRRDRGAGELGSFWRTESPNGRGVGDTEGDGRGQGWSGRPLAAGEGEPEPFRSLQDVDRRAVQPWRVGGRAAQAGGAEWWSAEPPVGRVAHGVPHRLDQLAALGNALVPQIAEWIGSRVVTYELSREAA
jgi:DNA (cytosine-5)-methyltransferase 1